MEDMKHLTEVLGRSIPGRLDRVIKRAIVKSIRNKIRKFMSQWRRETKLTIPKDVMTQWFHSVCLRVAYAQSAYL